MLRNDFNGYEDRELTPYDRFILNKRGIIESEEETDFDDYDNYLCQQLRRKTSDGKVLSREEYYSQGGAAVKKPIANRNSKIMFICYVIIMLAVALLIIVRSTSGIAQHSFAGADSNSNASQTVDEDVITPLEIEEEEDESKNGFDKFLDSLQRK